MTFHRTNFPRRRGFSLTEILIVIALIVLMLALAMPAFNFITGGKSIDGAMNQISAFLSRARTEAVGLQEIRGVMFYIDPKTDREMMTLVKETPGKDTVDTPNNSAVDVWIGLNSNADQIPLPKGVGIQVLNDATGGSGLGYDRYVGFNSLIDPTLGTSVPIGGVILFDGYGRLTSVRYGFRMTDLATSKTGPPNAMGNLIWQNPAGNCIDTAILTVPNQAPFSSFGFLLFERGVMLDKYGTDFDQDPNFLTHSTISPQESNEEQQGLDDIATAVLINRYNGTLVKGE